MDSHGALKHHLAVDATLTSSTENVEMLATSNILKLVSLFVLAAGVAAGESSASTYDLYIL